MMHLFYKLDQGLAARRDLTATAKIVFAVIRDRIGKNEKCWPGERTLARDAGIDRSTVRDCIRRLTEAGLLEVNRRGTGLAPHYSIPDETGGRIQPVEESDRLENPTTGGGRTQPEPVGRSNLNQKDPLTRPRSGAASPLYCEDSSPKRPTRRKASPPDPSVKKFIDWFFERYREIHGRKYIVRGGKDGEIVKRLLGQLEGDGVDPLRELQRAARNMLADAWGKPNASIGLLSGQINKWRSEGRGSGENAKDDDEISRRNWRVLEAERKAARGVVEEPALARGSPV